MSMFRDEESQRLFDEDMEAEGRIMDEEAKLYGVATVGTEEN